MQFVPLISAREVSFTCSQENMRIGFQSDKMEYPRLQEIVCVEREIYTFLNLKSVLGSLQVK